MNMPSYCSSSLFYTNQKMVQHKKKHIFRKYISDI